jgi:hypothetical protein
MSLPKMGEAIARAISKKAVSTAVRSHQTDNLTGMWARASSCCQMRPLSSRATVINAKKGPFDVEHDLPLRSPSGFGGSGGCGSAKSAAPAMTVKLEQKAIEELEDMSIIEEVCPDFWCLVYVPKCVLACARADIGMCTLTL